MSSSLQLRHAAGRRYLCSDVVVLVDLVGILLATVCQIALGELVADGGVPWNTASVYSRSDASYAAV